MVSERDLLDGVAMAAAGEDVASLPTVTSVP